MDRLGPEDSSVSIDRLDPASPRTPNAPLETSALSRRTVILGAAMVVATAALEACARPRDKQTSAPAQTQGDPAGATVNLGSPEAFALGSVTDRTRDAKTFIVHTGDGLIALVPVCTHQGCQPRYTGVDSGFFCPCHGAAFAADGAVTRGPASAPLARFALSVSDGHLVVDTAKIISRQNVQPSDFLKI